MLGSIQKKSSAKVHNSSKNYNFLDEGNFIRNIYVGDQNKITVSETEKELKRLIATIRYQKGKVLILTDISRIGRITLSARKKGLEVLNNLDFDKLAIFGNLEIGVNVVNVLILVSGLGFKAKFFTSESEALNWLKNNP